MNFIRVSDIDIPDAVFHPYKSNNQKLDFIFSEDGGLVPSQSILLTGMAGAGKTTFICHYAAEIAASQVEDAHIEFEDGSVKNSGPVILINLEMSDVQIKRLAKRIPNLTKLLIFKPEEYDYVDWLDKFIDLKPSVVILDSIQKLSELIMYANDSRATNRSFQRHQREIAIMFNSFSKLTYTPTILIGHTNKAGKYLGPSGLKHELDSHLEIVLDKETNTRVVRMDKNRWGNSNIEINMKFENNEIHFENSMMDFINEMNITEYNASEESDFAWQFVQDEFDKLMENNTELLNKYKYNTVELSFTNNRTIRTLVVEGVDKQAIIELGVKKLRLIEDDTWSKYPDENRYINLVCENKEDRIRWMLYKEFAGLFYKESKRRLEFFQYVYEFYKENQI